MFTIYLITYKESERRDSNFEVKMSQNFRQFEVKLGMLTFLILKKNIEKFMDLLEKVLFLFLSKHRLSWFKFTYFVEYLVLTR